MIYPTHSNAPLLFLLIMQAHSAPSIGIIGAQAGKLYTLVMSDPDPPDPKAPIYREWLHWLIVNIPGGTAEITEGTEVTRYM